MRRDNGMVKLMETRNETSRFGQTVCLDSKFQVNRSRFNLVPGKRRVDSSSLVDTRIQWKLRDKSKASSSMQYIRTDDAFYPFLTMRSLPTKDRSFSRRSFENGADAILLSTYRKD